MLEKRVLLPETQAVILAAGKGTRMKTGTPKVLHKLDGKPVLRHVVDAVRGAGVERILVVVGEHEAAIRAAMSGNLVFIRQAKPLGTGHALMAAAREIHGFDGDLLVLVGDAPFITPDLLRRLVELRQRGDDGAAILTAVYDETPPYGRVIRNREGRVQRLIEEPMCTPEQKKMREVSTFPYCLCAARALPLLKKLRKNPHGGEYNLPDLIEILNGNGHTVSALLAPDYRLTLGLNTREDLARAREIATGLV